MEEKLKLTLGQSKNIDKKKRALEARAIARFNKIFNNIANDVSILLLAKNSIDSRQIADNYKPDFIGALRTTYREVIDTFGFAMRAELSSKGMNFGVSLEKKRFSAFLTTKQEESITIPSPGINTEQEINNKLLEETILFINNQSEEQARIITETNAKEIEASKIKADADYNFILADTTSKLDSLKSQLSDAEMAIFFGFATEKEAKRLREKISSLSEFEKNVRENRFGIVSDKFKKTFVDRSRNRSEIISEYEVGQTESSVRHEEARTINDFTVARGLAGVKKNWVSVGDSRVREAHAIADYTYHYNPINVSEFFYVGGERLRYPRDSSGSASNIIRCRCVSNYIISDSDEAVKD